MMKMLFAKNIFYLCKPQCALTTISLQSLKITRSSFHIHLTQNVGRKFPLFPHKSQYKCCCFLDMIACSRVVSDSAVGRPFSSVFESMKLFWEGFLIVSRSSGNNKSSRFLRSSFCSLIVLFFVSFLKIHPYIGMIR